MALIWSDFTKRTLCQLFLCVALFVLGCVSLTTSWYYQTITVSQVVTGNVIADGSVVGASVLNSTSVDYDLTGSTLTVEVGGRVSSETFSKFSVNTLMLNSVFEACRVFSIVSLVLVGLLAVLLFCMIPDRFRNKLIFATSMSGVRIFIRLTILLIVICNIISFLVFLGVTQGFKEAANNNCPHGPCRRFADSVRSEAGSVSTSNTVGVQTAVHWKRIGWSKKLSWR